MQLSEIFRQLGPSEFEQLLQQISIGRLKTYHIYEQLKEAARLPKLNVELLRRNIPKFWESVTSGNDELGRALAQAILVHHLDMVIEALDTLGIPHHGGFFSKDVDVQQHLSSDWQRQLYERLKDRYPEPLVLFYINHLAWELEFDTPLFQPAAPQS